MKKIIFLICILFSFTTLFSQNNHDELIQIINTTPGVYVDVIVNSQEEVQSLIHDFSIERGDVRKMNDQYQVKIWLTKIYITAFIERAIPYQIDYESIDGDQETKVINMATTFEQMASWNRYPTYSVYLQMMNNFQTNFPTLCKIDTILALTPLNHAIIAARITNPESDNQYKPAFLYSACMHGDEICGYTNMLRLIDYLLNNPNDSVVQKILNNVELYICPLENPDGTFPSNNNSVNGSVRTNSAGYDLNRNYPEAGNTSEPTVNISEINAMLSFFDSKSIIMSTNFHGGAELYNYAWDSWTSSQREHPDKPWWLYIGNNFVDTLRNYAPSTYFLGDGTGSVTNGGDWYVVTGSRLDCLNYYHHCRDVTIEISSVKKTDTNQLPNYWNYLYRSLLHYIVESSNGFSGIVTDSVTNIPLESMIYINSHDNTQSTVFSFLPSGKYFRPILGGTYSVTYSATGYKSKTFTIDVVNDSVLTQNVQLVPINFSVNDINLDQLITIYPNPVTEFLKVTFSELIQNSKISSLFSMNGACIQTIKTDNNEVVIDVRNLTSGVYFMKFDIGSETILKKVVISK
jgi:hypothetical protein